MRRKIIVALVLATACMSAGCQKKVAKVETIQTSAVMGAAEGTVTFEEGKEPEIEIKEIRSYLGEEIDYSNGIDVENVELFDDFQMWVDATAVDIYTVGRYTAVYRFLYDEKEVEKSVGVTILAKEDSVGEQNGGVSAGSNGSAGTSGSLGGEAAGPSGAGGDSSGASDGVQTPTAGSSQEIIYVDEDGEQVTLGTTATPTQPGNDNNSNPAQPGQPQTGQSQPAQPQGGQTQTGQTASKEIITTKGSQTLKPSTIGYTNIELLSGNYVKIKCTSAKYIISTRTDQSQTVKNGVTYQVSKLIVTYNTGAEQILETVEQAIG